MYSWLAILPVIVCTEQKNPPPTTTITTILFGFKVFFPSLAAVYSREYTSSSKRDPGSPQPLPYFVLAQKLMSKRASDMSKLKSEISSLEEQ